MIKMRKWHRQWECVILFLLSSALSENEVSELSKTITRVRITSGLLGQYQ